jgi:predicted nucleic-acid-binding protein
VKQKFLIDTNIIIRILTGEPKELAEEARLLIHKVEDGELVFYIPSMVVAECCWVLQSVYKLSKHEVSQALKEFIQSDGVEIEESFVLNALDDHAMNNVDFIDAYLSQKSRLQSLSVITWNKKDFKRLSCEYYAPADFK